LSADTLSLEPFIAKVEPKKWIHVRIPVKNFKISNYQTPILGIGFSQLAHTQDMVLIRFADVLLMHAELSETATNLNRVRARVDLPAINYSLAALKRERRWELSFEGLRYFDLMRWNDAAEALASQEGVAIKNKNVDTQMRGFGGGYRARYEATGGFWPIPTSQIALSNGVLLQNKGWGEAAHEYTGW
jgi:starch-binding outer membrane protein, SusD/RagB family